MINCPLCQGKGTIDCAVHLDHHRRFVSVAWSGEKLYLPPSQFALMQVMVRRMPNPVTTEALMRSMWGEREPERGDLTLKAQICYLRKKLRLLGLVIHRFVGVGYGLTRGEVENVAA